MQSFFEKIAECSQCKEKLIGLYDLLSTEYDIISKNNSKPIQLPDDLISSANLKFEKSKLEGLLKQAPYVAWTEDKIKVVENLLTEAINISDTVNSLKAELLEIYEPEIFELDYKAILTRIKTEYTSFTKIFKKEYKQDKKSIQALHKDKVKKISDEELLSVVERLRNLDEIRFWYEENSVLLNTYFDGFTKIGSIIRE